MCDLAYNSCSGEIGPKACSCIEKISEYPESIIYIKTNPLGVTSFAFENIYGVICDLGDNTFQEIGFPHELIKKVDLSEFAPDAQYEPESDVVYFSPKDYDNKEQVLNIIRLFNRLPSMRISIYTASEIQHIVEPFANENVAFYEGGYEESFVLKARLIITYGHVVRKFIRHKIPTVVIGPYGFGGWVTPLNLKALWLENFNGRPNGYLREPIPLEILVDELMEINECTEISNVLNENLETIEVIQNKSASFSYNSAVKYFDSLYQKVNDCQQRGLLIPKLASNTNIIQNKNSISVQRKGIFDILFSISADDTSFLDDLTKGEICCHDLQKKHKMKTEEFWEILYSLMNKKAIVFNEPILK